MPLPSVALTLNVYMPEPGGCQASCQKVQAFGPSVGRSCAGVHGTAENIIALEDAGIRAYVPLPNFTQRTGFHGADRFTYDAHLDIYRCPNDALLRPRKTSFTKGAVVYHADRASCNACPRKAACTESDHGPVAQRRLAARYLDRVRGNPATEPYKRAMRKRQVWVEPLFGEAKEWHHLRNFRLRGLEKVNIEGQLIAAGQTLKR